MHVWKATILCDNHEFVKYETQAANRLQFALNEGVLSSNNLEIDCICPLALLVHTICLLVTYHTV